MGITYKPSVETLKMIPFPLDFVLGVYKVGWKVKSATKW